MLPICKSVFVRVLACVCGMAVLGSKTEIHAGELFPEVNHYIEQRLAETEQIPASRQAELESLAQYVRQCLREGRTAELTFICTHNSRRSHLSQVWAKVAAAHFGLDNVRTYSGGTEVTAFNPRAVAALRRCGLQIDSQDKKSENPRYRVRFSHAGPTEVCFSKLFNDPANPSSRFGAVLTCSQADEACPIVENCDLRVAITYEDPKAADGTPGEQAAYDERTRQISREMLYLMSKVASPRAAVADAGE